MENKHVANFNLVMSRYPMPQGYSSLKVDEVIAINGLGRFVEGITQSVKKL